jgi:hypothetical protein
VIVLLIVAAVVVVAVVVGKTHDIYRYDVFCFVEMAVVAVVFFARII